MESRFYWQSVLGGLACLLAACSLPTYAGVPVTVVTATPSSTPIFRPSATPGITATPTGEDVQMNGPTQPWHRPPGQVSNTPTAPPFGGSAATDVSEAPASGISTPTCPESKGTVIRDYVYSPRLEQSLLFRVYLPPCYEAQAHYPVLYLIHGLYMNEAAWDQLGADETADVLIAAGEIPPLIMVMPRAPDDDRFVAAFAADLVPYVDEHYRTRPDRLHRALGGMSRGGGWTVRIGFQHPELFGGLGLHSLAIFYVDEDNVWRWLNDLPDDQPQRIYLDIGEKDAQGESARWLHEALTERQIDHEFHLNPGGHDQKYWQQHLPEYLQWYTATW